MGIAPYKYFTYDGESSRDYDVYLTGEGVFNAPERAVEMLEIPGRNGNYALDQGKFNNISVTYKAGIVDVSESDFADKVSAVRNWLCSKVGYKRLSDDYNPDEYRIAVYKSGVNIDHVDLKTGEFEITFDCKPQRWLTSGETPVTIGEWGETETVSGEVVEVEATEADAVKSLVADIDPIQDLHGYDAPWVGGAGKNKCVFNNTTRTINGITFTVNADGSVTANGTATANTSFHCYTGTNNTFDIDNGTYAVSGCPSNGSSSTYRFYVDNRSADGTSSVNSVADSGSGNTITITNGKARAYIFISSGYTANSLVFRPMIRLSSVTDTTFEPYENICPISGHTEIGVSVVGKNLLDNDKTKWSKSGTNASGYTPDANRLAPTGIVLPCINGESYTLSVTNTDGKSYRVGVNQYANGTRILDSGWQSFPYTYTVDDNADTIRIVFRTEPSGSMNDSLNALGASLKIQLEFGSNATTYEPYNGQSYTTQLGQTVYGGTLDLVSGELTVTHEVVDIGDLEWIKSGVRFYTTFNTSSPNCPYPTHIIAKADAISSAYKVTDRNTIENYNGVFSIHYPGTGAETYITVVDTAYSDAATFKTAMTGQTICYELATPQTYQLTPQQVELLLGTNNIFADSGDVTLEYGHNPMVLVNPTPFDAEPLLAMKGYGNISINSQTVSIANVEIGEVVLNNGGVLPINKIVSLDIANIDLMETGDTITISSGTVITQGLTKSNSGKVDAVTVSVSGGTIAAHIVNVPSSNELVQVVVDSPITFLKGTNKTESIPLSISATYKVNGITTTYTGTYSNDFMYSAQYNQIKIMIGDMTPTLPGELIVYDPMGETKYSEVIGYSTKTALGDTIYIDLDIGEAYVDNNGVISNMNNIVTLGSDLPKLSSGANTFNYDNTITSLEVTPRYWKV